MIDEKIFSNESISVTIIGNKIIIRFARPEIRNPLSIIILKQLKKIISEIAKEDKLQNVIFTGTNDIFASGANLREIAKITTATASEFALRGQNLMSDISRLTQKTTAAINGFCFGGALDLALACDKRIATPNAVFCHPGVNLGIITGWGGTQILPRLIGQAQALEMFLTAKRINAKEALKIGLIDEINTNPLEYVLAN